MAARTGFLSGRDFDRRDLIEEILSRRGIRQKRGGTAARPKEAAVPTIGEQTVLSGRDFARRGRDEKEKAKKKDKNKHIQKQTKMI